MGSQAIATGINHVLQIIVTNWTNPELSRLPERVKLFFWEMSPLAAARRANAPDVLAEVRLLEQVRLADAGLTKTVKYLTFKTLLK